MNRWPSGSGLGTGAAAVAAILIAALAYFGSNRDDDFVSDDPAASASPHVEESMAEAVVVDPAAVPLTTCSLGCGGTHE